MPALWRGLLTYQENRAVSGPLECGNVKAHVLFLPVRDARNPIYVKRPKQCVWQNLLSVMGVFIRQVIL
jgi:hypothetical protein